MTVDRRTAERQALAAAAGQGPLRAALTDMALRPVTHLVGAWNWKTAAISVVIRATLFFATNLRSGRGSALRASLVEAGFAIVAAGLLGAATQRIRHARPVWATGLVVWLGLPVVLLTLQATVHRLFGTPHLQAGLIVSFCMAAVGSGFNWFAQQKGVLVTGEGAGGQDWRALPGLVLGFVLAGPRALLAWPLALGRERAERGGELQ
jgi:hypothetical protein